MHKWMIYIDNIDFVIVVDILLVLLVIHIIIRNLQHVIRY